MRLSTKQLIAFVITIAAINGSAYAQIEIDSVTAALGLGGGGDKTFITDFDAGFSDKMVVFLGAEHGFPQNIGGRFNSVSLNGVPLTPIVQEESDVPTIAAFYLDDPRASAGVGDLVVNQASHNQSIYSIYLLSNTAAGVGNAAAEWGAGDNSIDLTTTAANSLVLVGHENAGPNGGNGAGNSAANAPLSEDTPYLEVGSAWTSLSTAHAFVSSPGTASYSYTGDDPNDLIAMAAVEILEGAPPPLLSLSVNTLTGAVTMQGDNDEPISISYYEITSAGNSLSAAGWTSLADQGFNGWDEAGGSGPDGLAEAYLTGNREIGADSGIFLGIAYDPTIDARDLTFRFLTDEGKAFDGTVEYGHFVYVNPDDAEPPTANPEPNSLALMVIGLVGFCFRGRRRRVTRG